jgi:hypothetical protein
MQDFVFWTGVMGGIPLAAALIRVTLDWWSDPVRARSIARGPAAAELPASDSGQCWMDV